MNTPKQLLLIGTSFIVMNVSVMAQPVVTAPSLSSNSGSLVGINDIYGRPAPDSRGWTDPALSHNKLLQQRDGMYKLIGTYKVVGSQFLFGEHNKGDMFSTEAKAYNVYISYNTYNQEVEFYSTSNPNQPLVREPGTLDSFIIQENAEVGITQNLKFIYGSLLGVKDKAYFQEVYKGAKYSLYKKYKSELGYSSNNYASTDLRQFDLQYEYYYSDGTGGLKKLKPNTAAVIKEFKDVKDLSAVVTNEALTANQQETLRKAFELLNQLKAF